MDDALQKAVAQVLEANPDGLNEREIRQAVLKAIGLRRRPPEVQTTLRENPDVFIGPLADGRWRLKAVVETEETVTKGIDLKEVRQERGEPVHPFIASLPALDAFIAFDLETTGLNQARDHIVQISAVRIIGGQPAVAQAEDGRELAAAPPMEPGHWLRF